MSFTPGPWKVVDHSEPSADYTLIESDRSPFFIVSLPPNHKSRDESEANARLIAAAPDLLRLLGDALTQMEEKDWQNRERFEPWERTLQRIRDGLAKARGESS